MFFGQMTRYYKVSPHFIYYKHVASGILIGFVDVYIYIEFFIFSIR
jgi:hypothetical protein